MQRLNLCIMQEVRTMQAIFDYLETYGKYGFAEKPFNPIDGMIFSQLVYTDFKNIATGKTRISLADAAKKFYEMYTDEEIENLIGISTRSARLLTECAKTKRYGNVALCYFVNNINDAIDKQFCAVNFVLGDGSLTVAFRGTDVTSTGTKESAMLSYMFPVPAQIEALHYFQETAMLNEGDVRICGHSKGGNLAVFAAVNCSNSLKKHLQGVYEYDAPGFPQWFFERYDYREIKDKIHLYTPQSSVIGRMLCHDVKPVIVHSTNSGLKQHNVDSWEIEEDCFVIEAEYNRFSNMVSEYINTLIEYVGDDDLDLFFATVEYIFVNIGIDDFYDLKAIDFKSTRSLIGSYSTLSTEQKARFRQIVKSISADFTKGFIAEKTKNYFRNRKNNKTQENS